MSLRVSGSEKYSETIISSPHSSWIFLWAKRNKDKKHLGGGCMYGCMCSGQRMTLRVLNYFSCFFLLLNLAHWLATLALLNLTVEVGCWSFNIFSLKGGMIFSRHFICTALKLEMVSINFCLEKNIFFLFKYVHNYSVISSLDVKWCLRVSWKCHFTLSLLRHGSRAPLLLSPYAVHVMRNQFCVEGLVSALMTKAAHWEEAALLHRLLCWLLLEQFVPGFPILRS